MIDYSEITVSVVSLQQWLLPEIAASNCCTFTVVTSYSVMSNVYVIVCDGLIDT